MKTKRTPKYLLDTNEVIGYNSKIKLNWGYISWYAAQTNKNKWNYQIYWTNTETGSDNTIEIKKNQNFDSLDECVNYMIGLARDYFEDHPIRIKIEANIGILEDLRGNF